MASQEDIARMRARVGRLLKSQACLEIRFKISTICIQRFMYTYIGQGVIDDLIHIDLDNNPVYDPDTRTLGVESDAKDSTIVHEATHAIINATNPGQVFTKGVHEAAGYLAEAVWAINADREISTD